MQCGEDESDKESRRYSKKRPEEHSEFTKGWVVGELTSLGEQKGRHSRQKQTHTHSRNCVAAQQGEGTQPHPKDKPGSLGEEPGSQPYPQDQLVVL